MAGFRIEIDSVDHSGSPSALARGVVAAIGKWAKSPTWHRRQRKVRQRQRKSIRAARAIGRPFPRATARALQRHHSCPCYRELANPMGKQTGQKGWQGQWNGDGAGHGHSQYWDYWHGAWPSKWDKPKDTGKNGGKGAATKEFPRYSDMKIPKDHAKD